MILPFYTTLGLVSLVLAKVQFMGMNIAGFDFGCQIDGTCPLGSAQAPNDGAGQIQHFVNDDEMNIFRFPVSWQFLVNNNIGGTLDSTNFGRYDQLMQSCIATSSYCAIDVHNFARVNGQIIGQGGPSDTQFADLWTQLATKYKSTEKVIFGLMNEPHDVDIGAWANTVQVVVTAIRNAGAKTQMILLPGNNFASAGQFVPNGSGAALIKVKNPDGSIDGLILDLHKYLDIDNSGEHAECTTDNISDAFTVVAAFLRANGRQAIVSETGAGSTSSCFEKFCAQNTFLNQNSDVFLGIIAWAAGSFSTSYVLSLTPTKKNGKYVDNALASQCVVTPWLNAGTEIITSAVPSSALPGSISSDGASLSPEASASETIPPQSSDTTISETSIILTQSQSSHSPQPTISGFSNGTGTGQGSAGTTAGPTSTAATLLPSSAATNSRCYARSLVFGSFFAAMIL